MRKSTRTNTVHRFHGCSVNHRLAGDRGRDGTLLRSLLGLLQVLGLQTLRWGLLGLRRMWHGRRPALAPVRVR